MPKEWINQMELSFRNIRIETYNNISFRLPTANESQTIIYLKTGLFHERIRKYQFLLFPIFISLLCFFVCLSLYLLAILNDTLCCNFRNLSLRYTAICFDVSVLNCVKLLCLRSSYFRLHILVKSHSAHYRNNRYRHNFGVS